VSLASHFGGGIEDGTDDLVVAGAPAEVAGEPVTRLGLARIRIAVEQRLGGDQQARRTEAALQRRMLQEFSLQRMQVLPARHALDGLDRAALRLHRKHQARADQAAVDGHAAGAAVARAASLLAAGEMELVAQRIEQRELRLAQELGGLAVDRGRYVMLAHRRSLIDVLLRARRRWSPPGAPSRPLPWCDIQSSRACRRSACRRAAPPHRARRAP
jgi:hypothetical protein